MRHFYKAVFLLVLLCAFLSAAEKQQADWVIQAKYVVTMDGRHRLIEDGAVAVRGQDIAGVGTQSEIARRFTARHILSKPQDLIAPGMIDTHTHAPMSLFRAFADDRRLEDWLHNFIFPAESKNVSPEFVRWGTRLACLEMLLAGITTYTDMYYFEETEAEAAKEAGVRGVLGQTVIGFPAPDHKTWQQAMTAAEQFIQRYRDDPLIVPTVAPHAIYTTPDDALLAAHRLAVKYQIPLLIHLAETKAEREETIAKRGMTPAQVLQKLGLLDGLVVAAHSIWEDNNDLRILREHNTGIAHCPSSNMKLADGVARVTDMLKMGIDVGLGTDGFAGSNDTADLMREMDIASKLQKVTQMNPRVVPAEQAFEMATIGGARVLGMEKKIGSLEIGKRADLITISLTHPNAIPLYDVYSQLAYAAKAADVDDVFVNGRQVVSERRVLTLDRNAIYGKAEEYKRRILTSLKH